MTFDDQKLDALAVFVTGLLAVVCGAVVVGFIALGRFGVGAALIASVLTALIVGTIFLSVNRAAGFSK
jgi:hypothetical protein